MKRLVFGLPAAIVAFVALAPSALAHGGQFRGPGGSVPPGLRNPSDPTPPPPPPPTNQPPVTTPGDPNPSPPPVTTPNQPPPATPPITTPMEPNAPGKKTPTSFDQWVFWWNNNNEDILHLKAAIYQLRGSVGEDFAGNRSDSTRATEKQVKETLIPALLWALNHDNKQYFDTESAAYIALAKVTDDPEHVKLLMNGVYLPDGKPNKIVDQIVNESAALSLGLLRRADVNKQFDAKLLDQVRDFCFTAFEDEALATRSRAFAMLSIGLLGDQRTLRAGAPTTGGGLFYAPDPAAAGMSTVDRIVDLLHRSYKNEDLPVCLLLALSLQDPVEIGRKVEVLDALKDCALKGRLFKENASGVVPSYAALALGRVGTKDYIPAMLTALKVKATDLNVKRSAAIALGQLGRRLDGAERAQLAVDLWKAQEEVSDYTAKNFAIISLAYLLKADIEAKRTDIINARGANVAEGLIQIAKEGKYSQRPYGALAVGIVGRAIGDRPDIAAYGEFRVAALRALQEGLEDKKLDKRGRAAFAVGLGLLQDSDSKGKLLALVSSKDEDRELRGYSAVALGMIGETSKEIEKAIVDAMRDRTSEELRSQTAIALGLLGSRQAVDVLLDELDKADSQNVQGQIVIALGKIGDARTIPKLVTLMKDSGKPDPTKSLCCAALGLIGDLELIPSLARISKDINYRASPDVINEVLSIL